MVIDLLSPNLSHTLANYLLSFYSGIVGEKPPPTWSPLKWKHLYFPNPLAPAGGVDKSAKHMHAWWALGAGFLEIGTITPQAQKKNLGCTLKKNSREQILWNYMGFPNDGTEAVQKRLLALQGFKPTPIFANIGKSRDTKMNKAVEDYLFCIEKLHPYVDAFVINISSPNTQNLRDLSQPEKLIQFLQTIQQKLASFSEKKPFFIKWSPDLSEKKFLMALDLSIQQGAEGHILCNTSVQKNAENGFPQHGGISGRPLSQMTKKKLELTHKHLGDERKNQLLISVGGVLEPVDVFERLNLGADLVQSYSALVFKGPLFFRKTSRLKLN